MKRKTKLKIFQLHDWKCYYCKRVIRDGGKSLKVEKSAATIDHKVPMSIGGSNSQENLVAACFECNNKKGDRTDVEFLKAIPQIIATRVRDGAMRKHRKACQRAGKEIEKKIKAIEGRWGCRRLVKNIEYPKGYGSSMSGHFAELVWAEAEESGEDLE